MGMIVFLVVIFALVAGAIIYMSGRYALFFPSVPRKVWMWSFVALFAVAFVCMTAFATIANPLAKAVFIAGGIGISLFLFSLLSVMFVDLLHLVFHFSPFVRRGLSIGLGLLLTSYGIWNAYTIRVKEITIPLNGLTREIRAVHITDVHLGNFRGKGEVDKIVGKIKEINPDVVFNTGDMFDSKAHFGKDNDVLAAFRTLGMPHYFVYGNHDQHVGTEEVIRQMRGANATVLLNEVAYFGELQIIGLNNMLADRHSFDIHTAEDPETIEEVLNGLVISKDYPTIVLHHRPDGVEYMQRKDVELLLAGHTHAGQVFPFIFIAKLMFGYNRGLYRYETMNIYVSEGSGTIFVPVRLGTRSEMSLIKLIPASKKENARRY